MASSPLLAKNLAVRSARQQTRPLPSIDEDLELAILSETLPESVPERFNSKALPDPFCLSADSSVASRIVHMLTNACQADRSCIVAWLVKAVPSLSVSEHGSNVVKTALEHAIGPDRHLLIAALHGSVINLYESRFGHEVLARLIEVMPVVSLGFVITEITGRAMLMAQNRFGSHILELLIMYFKESQITGLLDELLQEIEVLSKHQYGNTVVQHLVEYGSETYRANIIQRLLPHVPLLIMHRSGSHVIQRLLDYGDMQQQQSIIFSLLQASKPVCLADVACSRCGSVVLESIHDIGDFDENLCCQLEQHLPRLSSTKFGRRVINLYGLSR